MPENKETKERKLIPLADFPNHYPWPSIGGLRHLRFFGDQNGFNSCVVTVGRRVLIDVDRFFEWCDRQGSDHEGEGL